MDDLDTQESVCLVQQHLWALQVRGGRGERKPRGDAMKIKLGQSSEGTGCLGRVGAKGLLRGDLVSSRLQDSS